MVRYKVHIDKKLCIGSGHCASVCPENFSLIDTPEGVKAKPIKQIISEDEYVSNEQAVDMCPVEAIKIEKVKVSKMMADEMIGEEEISMY